tara:strand:- start:1289 stop:2047 length:759 start_codon:yes stop_codon:yes gene_type:complete
MDKNQFLINKEEAKAIKGHLEKLASVKNLANHNDREFLNKKIWSLKNYDPYVSGMPFGSSDRNIVRRIIKHAKLFRDLGEEAYLINGKVVDMNELKGEAKKVISNSKGNLSRNDVYFLGQSIIQSPEHRTFSARQILWLEKLAQHAEKCRVQSNGESFNPYAHYKGISGIEMAGVLNFALIGKLGKAKRPKGDYLETIRTKWFDEETGLDRLKESLKNYCSNRRLRTRSTRFDRVFSDMETYFRKNSEAVSC